MKKFVMIIGCLALGACGNTVTGIGKDIQKMGEGLQKKKVEKPLTKEELTHRNSIGQFSNMFHMSGGKNA
jgi:predicted small secreted protein|tara:strand:+ start:1517 stop:1726 length:210 start_codon:yes stop_codon:yes gene_type:complete